MSSNVIRCNNNKNVRCNDVSDSLIVPSNWCIKIKDLKFQKILAACKLP